ncbi:MAG: spermidine/putrescine ABC transporter permease PotC [Candidatus Methylumidiphilus sp.]
MARLKTAYLVLIFGWLYLPMAVLILYSFNPSKYGLRWEGFSLAWYQRLAQDAALLEAAAHSLAVAGLSATLACLLGAFGAIGLQRYRFPGKTAVQALLFTQLMSPDIVMAVSLLVLFIALRVELGFTALLLAHATFSLPFVTVTVQSRLQGFDRYLIEAAQDLGAGEWQVLRHVLLPLAAPAIAAGWLLSFTLSLDDVVVSFFVTGPDFEVLPLRIYSLVRMGVTPEVNALATALFALSLLLVGTAQWLLHRKPG